MSVNFEANVYGLTGLGTKVKIGHALTTVEDAYLVGGKIFHIDNDAIGAFYHFFNKNGEEITDIKVGDSPYAYTVYGNNIDNKNKYYVFSENPMSHNDMKWTYGTYDGNSTTYKLVNLGTQDGVGKGKTNTQLVLSADNGAYDKIDSKGDGSYVATIWNVVKSMNDNKVQGCEDWFIPSKAELELLRTATDIDGNNLINAFKYRIWSSTESSNSSAWAYLLGNWDANYANQGKKNEFKFIASRSF